MVNVQQLTAPLLVADCWGPGSDSDTAVQIDLPPPLGAGGTCDVCEIAAPVEQIPEH
jgi:hypothetical protein